MDESRLPGLLRWNENIPGTNEESGLIQGGIVGVQRGEGMHHQGMMARSLW